MRFLRHLGRLMAEFGLFAWQNKAWWIIPIVLVFLVLGFLVFSVESVAPWLYSFF